MSSPAPWRGELLALGFDPGCLPSVSGMSAAEAAPIIAGQGWHVVESGGVLWRGDRFKPIWTPIDSLAPLAPERIRPPRPRLGHLAAVTGVGNTVLPVEMLTGVAGLSLYVQPTPRRRSEVRAALRRNEFGVGADLVAAQGWETMRETHARVGHRVAPSQQAFRNELNTLLGTSGGLLISGWGEGRLRGFLMGHVIGPTGYISRVCSSAQGLANRVGAGLYWLALATLAGTEGVRQVRFGPYFPENPTLRFFKASFGVRLHSLAAVGHINPIIAGFLRARRPQSYIRLGGPDARVRARLGVPPAGRSLPLPAYHPNAV